MRKPGTGTKVNCSTEENFALCAEVDGAPDEIVYLPEGTFEITPSVNGKPKKLKIEIDGEIEAAFQRDLDARLSASPRPTLDFGHEEGRASAIPKSFRYEPGRGLVLALDWTGSGREAIEGRDYSYFSPTFLFLKAGDGLVRPSGLAKTGAIGGLVNNPAFRQIERIAAEDKTEDHTNNQNEMEILAKCKLLTDHEAAKDNAEELATARVAAFRAAPKEEVAKAADSLRDTIAKASDMTLEELGIAADADIEAMAKALGTIITDTAKQKAEAAEAKAKAAKAFVEDGVKEGKILAKNEAQHEFWEGRYLADADKAEAELAETPKIAEGITNRVIKAEGNSKASDLETAIAKARAEDSTLSYAAAAAKCMAENPELEKAYAEEFGQ